MYRDHGHARSTAAVLEEKGFGAVLDLLNLSCKSLVLLKDGDIVGVAFSTVLQEEALRKRPMPLEPGG